MCGEVRICGGFLLAGNYFGHLEFVKKNFEYVILGIVVVSLLPVVFEWISAVRDGRREREQRGQSGERSAGEGAGSGGGI